MLCQVKPISWYGKQMSSASTKMKGTHIIGWSGQLKRPIWPTAFKPPLTLGIGADCVGANAALPLRCHVLAVAAAASPTRPLDTDVTRLHVPAAPQASCHGSTPHCRGRFAPSTIAADDHPQAARRFAPHNQRLQQPIPSASKLASGLAADPQRFDKKRRKEEGHYE
jgi:hypothetical protein